MNGDVAYRCECGNETMLPSRYRPPRACAHCGSGAWSELVQITNDNEWTFTGGVVRHIKTGERIGDAPDRDRMLDSVVRSA